MSARAGWSITNMRLLEQGRSCYTVHDGAREASPSETLRSTATILILHRVPQKIIDSRLIPFPLCFKPS